MYKNLTGREFLTAYFLDHGITEREIELYESWDCFCECDRIFPDEKGLEYAARRVDELIRYRDKTGEEVAQKMADAPWYGMWTHDFRKLCRKPPKNNESVSCILGCIYQGKWLLFGIGKEEVEITEDMRKNGKWSAFTYVD